MNTVEKGDKFEAKCHKLIKEAITNSDFAFPLRFAKIIPKAKYYSKSKEKQVIFDLAIEIWPPNSKNYSNLYIIECKDYANKKVPIGDLTKFAYDVNDVAELNGKAVFITSSSFTKPSIRLAKNKGMMLIEIENNDKLNILLHKKNRAKHQKQKKDHAKEFESFIKNVFTPLKVTGLKKLSSKEIEKETIRLLNDFNSRIISEYQGFEIQDLIEYVEDKYNIKTVFKNLNNTNTENKILGNFNRNESIINIDNEVNRTMRLGFVFAHELGHAILHNNIEINNELYNEFSDSEYNFHTEKHTLTNFKHWIEWQANKFASLLLLPSQNLEAHLIYKQRMMGISKYGHIYLDRQPVNRKDFAEIISYLTVHFNTSKTTIEYRLQELNLITYDNRELDTLVNRRKNTTNFFNYL